MFTNSGIVQLSVLNRLLTIYENKHSSFMQAFAIYNFELGVICLSFYLETVVLKLKRKCLNFYDNWIDF